MGKRRGPVGNQAARVRKGNGWRPSRYISRADRLERAAAAAARERRRRLVVGAAVLVVLALLLLFGIYRAGVSLARAVGYSITTSTPPEVKHGTQPHP